MFLQSKTRTDAAFGSKCEASGGWLALLAIFDFAALIFAYCALILFPWF